MVYLKKRVISDTRICYEYGAKEDVFYGSIEFEIDVSPEIDFEHRNVKLNYYGDNSFGYHTAGALQAIAEFVENNEFPEKYLRATH